MSKLLLPDDLAELSPEKRELLELLLQEEAEPEALPLSYAQRGLWFLDRLQPGNLAYILPTALRLTGALDREALRRALDEVVRRHEALRVVFQVEDNEPVQVLTPVLDVALPLVDLGALPGVEREAEVLRLAASEARRPFDLEQGPLLRTTLLRLGGREHVALFAMHHIVSDAWSIGVLVREVALLYTAFSQGKPSPLPELPVQYLDYVEWQRDWLSGERLAEQIAFWRERLEDAPALELPTDRRRRGVQGFRGDYFGSAVTPEVSHRVREIFQREGATPFMGLLAAFEVLLHRWSGQDDLVVGTTIANRRHSELEGLIGLFVNTLALRADLHGDPPFRELLARVRRSTLDAYAHQDLPFERLVAELGRKRDLARSPLFQVLFQVQNAPVSALDLPGLMLAPVEMPGETVEFDLVVSFFDTPRGFVGTWKYATDLFDRSTVERMAACFCMLLEGIAADPDRRLAELPLLPKRERRQITEWSAAGPSGDVFCLHERFAQRAAEHPDPPAVTFQGETLGYGELSRRANRLAHALRSWGIGPGERVGLCLERSLDQVVAILAVLKAGAAYVPIDPDYPAERIAWLLEDSRVPVLLTQSAVVSRLPEVFCRRVLLDEEALPAREDDPESLSTPDDPAYVIYTSGSTGRPKGVVVTHANVARLFSATDRWYGFGAGDVWTLFHSYAFDFSVWEIWGALLYGGRLVVVPYWVSRSPDDFYRLLAAERVTVLNQTPSAFRQLGWAEERGPHPLSPSPISLPPPAGRGGTHPEPFRELATEASTTSPLSRGWAGGRWERGPGGEDSFSLRLVIFGGEALEPASLGPWIERHGDACPTLVNMYGITETTVHVTHRPLRREDAAEGLGSVIGRAILDLSLHVLDRSFQPVPVGVAGEICVGGEGVAQSYLNRPALTAERFVPDPFGGNRGARLYRSGDLARRLPDGDLEYLGRIDHQVKVRGFRIELGEIEAALSRHPAVREAVVLARPVAGAEPRIVAYVVAGEGAEPSLGELRELAAASLPDYMLPSALMVLPSLPLTAHGKVDRRALPEPERTAVEIDRVEPRTELERLLASLFCQTLHLESVSIHDDFFALGGSSISGAVLVNQLQEALGQPLQVVVIFETPTVAGLAAWLEREHPHLSTAGAPPLASYDWTPGEAIPLSFAQERLWFLDQLDGAGATYNIPSALRLTGRLDVPALQGTLTEIVRRHAALRTSFAALDGRPAQVIAPSALFSLPVVDLAALGRERGEAEARRLAAEDAVRPFDLTRGPLLRATLLRFDAEEHAVAFNLHHIVGDGWSIGVLTRELTGLYAAFAERRLSPLPELPVQYADYARWQREWLREEELERQLAFWRGALTDAAVLQLPTDRPRPPVQTFRGAAHAFMLPPELAGALTSLGQSRSATLFMTLLAALAVLLRRWTGQDDVSIGSPVAGRNRVQLEGLIGLFVNTLVLRNDLSGDPAFCDLLARVREATVAAFAHQDVPFEKIVEKVQPGRDLSRTPLFQVLFVLQNVAAGVLRLPNLTLAPFPSGAEVAAKVDFTLAVTEGPAGLFGQLDYNVDLFEATTVERMAGHLETLLHGIVAEPDRPLSDLPLLTQAERHQLLDEWVRGTAVPRADSVERLFAEQVARTPGGLALVFGDERIKYSELDELSDRLAGRLRGLGVGPEVRVAVALKRSPELIVAFLGVLKAGGAYVPIDPSYPTERIEWMLADSGVRVVVTDPHPRPLSHPHSLPPGEGRILVTMPLPPSPGGLGVRMGEGGQGGEGSAYVIYTSGSTGRPKGVVALDTGLATFSLAMASSLGLGPGDRFLQFASPSFDASAVQIFPTLLSGATLVLHPDPTALSPAELLAFCEEQAVTVLDLPGALWRQMVQELAGGAASRPPVRAWLTGGESLSLDALRQWAGAVDADSLFLSSYGPTEATITTTVFTLAAHEVAALSVLGAPLGRPLGGAEVYLLDAALQPVPAGVTGGLYVGGTGLTRGYLDRPELTAAAFLPHPLAGLEGRAPGARLYQTGDLARWRPDGSLEFLGRADQQVKIRGFRLEPGEIEEVLARHPAVADVAVGVHEERADKRLVSWIVPAEPGGVQAPELRAFLRERLPEHMVPSDFVLLAAMPLTPSGKVDRRALPAPDRSRSEPSGWVAPNGEVEETLAAVWLRLLGVERAGRDDDFFDLGGHSLLATQLVSRVHEVFGVELPLRQVFETPTLSRLAAAVVAVRREQRGMAAPPLRPAARVSGEAVPLSFAQERLWFIDQLQPGRPTYNMPTAVRLGGSLDATALGLALGEVRRRHESLRTRFPVVGGAPTQVVDEPGPFRLTRIELSALPKETREVEMARLAVEESGLPFDLAAGPLLRAALVRLGAEEHVLLITMHHIVSDGWSMGVFIEEIGRSYQAFAAGVQPQLPDLPVQYADYARWQRGWLHGETLASQVAYWREKLGGEPAALELPLDRPRPAGDVFRGARRTVHVSLPGIEALEALGRREEATVFMALLAAFEVLLHRVTGQTDISVGTPVAGRSRSETEGLIGLFLNTLVLRDDLKGDPSFRELIGRVRRTALDAYSHQDLPFEKIVEELQPRRMFGQTPFFQAMFVLQNTPAGALEAGDLTLTPVLAYNETALFDLTVSVTRNSAGLTGWLEHKPELLYATTVQRWIDGFRRLIEAVAADPDLRLSELPLLSAAERHQTLAEWNDSEAERREVCLHELFAEQAARTPGAVAVMGLDGDLTYAELAARSEELARRLIAQGVHPGDRVAILMHPSPDRVATVLAVLQAGASYVPLDPAYPQERLDFMVQDAGASLVLTEAFLAFSPLPGEGGAMGEGPGVRGLAYVIYTSGSTGQPKGAMIEHRQAVNTILDINRRFGVGAGDRVFAVSALSFDLSVWDLFGTLAAGGTVILPPQGEGPDPVVWAERLSACGVTIWDSAPPLLEMLVESGARLPETLRLALLSGDWIPVSLPGRIRRQVPGCRVVSLGGATEGSIWSILHPIREADAQRRSIPYGRPMENQRFHVLDHSGRPSPIGVAGELCIGGSGVAGGYLGRRELTAERFVPDPFGAAGARLYRTGDLGRFLPDGTIEFLGRLDHQVKIRGFRVELGEIETVLAQHPAVREAVALVRTEGTSPVAGGDRRLVGYVVPQPAAVLDTSGLSELRAWLAARLPEHMVPPQIVVLDRLPLTPNGKLDRAALPAPEAPAREVVPPRDALEEQLAALWRRLLSVETLSIHDNFFELGGHSLMATRLMAAMRDEIGVELPVREVFDRPTIAGLALAVAESRAGEVAGDEVARMLDDLDGLSDEEIERLLAQEEGEETA